MDLLLGREQVIATPVTSSAHVLQARLDAAIAARSQAVTAIQSAGDALSLPAVYRGATLLSSMAAQFTPVAFRDDVALDDQPTVLKRPDADTTREDFLNQLVLSLVVHGEGWLWPTQRDFDSWPLHVRLLDPDEVVLTWNADRTLPECRWRDRPLQIGRDVFRVSVGKRVGHLNGMGPLQAALPALQAIAAADAYAAAWYASGGVPAVVLKSQATIADTEAERISTRWQTAGVAGSPRVLGGGLDADFPGVDPQAAQLLETRSEGARSVARLLGIPPALLLVDMEGSNVTYTNVATLITELVRSTLAPMYLVPIEQVMSDLLPYGQSVRFDLGELERASLSDRLAIYGQAIPLGLLDPKDAAKAEGWNPPPAPPKAAVPDPNQQGVTEGAPA